MRLKVELIVLTRFSFLQAPAGRKQGRFLVWRDYLCTCQLCKARRCIENAPYVISVCRGATRVISTCWQIGPVIGQAHMPFWTNITALRLHSHRTPRCTLFSRLLSPIVPFHSLFSSFLRSLPTENRFGTHAGLVLHAVLCHTRQQTRKSNFHRETYYQPSREYDVPRRNKREWHGSHCRSHTIESADSACGNSPIVPTGQRNARFGASLLFFH